MKNGVISNCFHVLIWSFGFCVDDRRCLRMSHTPWRRKSGFVAQALSLFVPACLWITSSHRGFSSWSGAGEATAGKELSVPGQDLWLHTLHYLPHPVVRGEWHTTHIHVHPKMGDKRRYRKAHISWAVYIANPLQSSISQQVFSRKLYVEVRAGTGGIALMPPYLSISTSFNTWKNPSAWIRIDSRWRKKGFSLRRN